MDSSAYTYTIASLQKEVADAAPHVPYALVKSAVAQSQEAIDAVAWFLGRMAGDTQRESGTAVAADEWFVPPVLLPETPGFIASQIRAAHREIKARLEQSVSPETRLAKRNFTELCSFLINSAHPRHVAVFDRRDSVGCAMAVFLIEASMHVGWCPNAFETRGKRAAHLYFTHAKKSLAAAGDSERATVMCYLWAAWLLAQKTEGIRDHFLDHENRNASYAYTFGDEGGIISYNTYHFAQPPDFVAIGRSAAMLPAAFSRLDCEQRTGLRLFAGDQGVEALRLLETVAIERPKFVGLRTTHECRCPGGAALRWTAVIQVFQNTTYRIDLLRASERPCRLSRVEFRIENPLVLSPRSPHVFYGRGEQDFVVEILKNPFSLSYDGQEAPGGSVFDGAGLVVGTEQATEMLIAWRCAKGVDAIDRTPLLGIFDA